MSTSLQLKSVRLRVADLDRSMAFYVGKIGFSVLSTNKSEATLAAYTDGPSLLHLTEDRAASPSNRRSAGLFHAAVLLPARAALGSWLRGATDAGVEFDGFSDHGVSEAIYLSDPEGNGLEFYSDRPPGAWPHQNGQLAMGTAPLDVTSLLAAGANYSFAPLSSAGWGHLHLRVTDPDRSADDYSRELGLSLTQRFGANARFLAADGYHHHLGLNNWGGIHEPRRDASLGMMEATFAKKGEPAERTLTDSDHLSIRIVPL
jgi:catechol 2,3-dioxygenase